MSTYPAEQTVGSFVAAAPLTSRVFQRYGIDFCCGGRVPLAEACAQRGLDVAEVLAALEKEAQAAPAPTVDWSAEPVSRLLDYILETHHTYLRRELPRLAPLMDKVHAVHGDRHPDVFPELNHLFTRLAFELEQHMQKEEQILFPAIRRVEEGGAGGMAGLHCGLQGPIRVMEWEHEECGQVLSRMRELTHGFVAPEGACGSFRALYAGLEALEADLHVHIHLENHFVHPRALAFSGEEAA